MASALNTYNADILAIGCKRCGAKVHARCRGHLGNQITGAHSVRVKAAGWRYLAWGIIVPASWHPPLVLP
jgi:hypothetical protein